MIVRRFLISIAFLAGAAALIASCRDAAPVGVDTRTSVVLAGGPASDDEGDDSTGGDDIDDGEDGDSLISCRRLRSESETKTIGPAGGFIEVRHNMLLIPRGALSAPVTITAVAPSDTVALVRFQPEGLQFAKTAYLLVSYDNCRVPRGVTPRIALVSDALDVIEFLTPVDLGFDDHLLRKDRKGRQVIGQLQHFSNYAVAW